MPRTLITGGTVLTMEPGNRPRIADVLVEDDRIVAVEASISADAERIDATGCIVLPGFVDTHRHVWQTSLKSLVPDETLKDYFRSVRFQGSLVYGPDDTYISTLAGSLEAIDAGVTTMLDFNNNVSSAETVDASLRGLRDAGIRARFALGMNDTFGQDAALVEPGGRAALLRATREAMPGDSALVTLGVALSDLPEVGAARIRGELELARELGLRSTTNSLAILFHEPVDDIAVFAAEGLIGPDLLWVHNIYASDEQLRMVTDFGTHTATCPEAELGLGMGRPATHRILAAGGHCSFGCDTVSSVSGDLLAQARIAMLVARQLDNDEAMQQGHAPESLAPTAETMLRGLTLWGAEALGIDDRTGSLVAGKQADVVVVRGDSPRTAPVSDPYGAVITHAGAADIDTVLVAGAVVKRGGALVADWQRIGRRLQASHDGLAERIESVGGWFPDPAIPLPW
jgi:cytosine/adenosine deaminase-related metal-dependent hydrolase